MRRHKIFYIPGFISLFGLLGLFLFFKPADPRPLLDQRPLREWLSYDNGPQKFKNGQLRFTKQMIEREIRCKKLIEIDLDVSELMFGDTELFNQKKQFIEREIQRTQFTGDTTGVLKVDLGSSNSFGDFMWIQKLALHYQFKQVCFYG
jgi:hypothetical protein